MPCTGRCCGLRVSRRSYEGRIIVYAGICPSSGNHTDALTLMKGFSAFRTRDVRMHAQRLIEWVFLAAGIYPTSGNDFDALAAAMDRLCLTDASIGVKRENSDALGAGFRCGCDVPACCLLCFCKCAVLHDSYGCLT